MPRESGKTTAKTNGAANANARPAPKKSGTASTASRLAREGAKDLGQAEETILAARPYGTLDDFNLLDTPRRPARDAWRPAT